VKGNQSNILSIIRKTAKNNGWLLYFGPPKSILPRLMYSTEKPLSRNIFIHSEKPLREIWPCPVSLYSLSWAYPSSAPKPEKGFALFFEVILLAISTRLLLEFGVVIIVSPPGFTARDQNLINSLGATRCSITSVLMILSNSL